MTRTGPAFHWFLPTGGDDRLLGASSHGGIIGAHTDPVPPSLRPATLDYLVAVARAADTLGYDGVLTPTGAHCADAWITTAALMPHTSRLKYLVALRPGLIAPVLAAQMAATFQRLSGDRLLLNVVAGGSRAEQRGYGDPLDHDQRYVRAAEFLAVFQAAIEGKPFHHQGVHYHVDNGLLPQAPDQAPAVYLGGSSEPALRVAARHADVYLTWGEPPAQVQEKIDRVAALAAREGRRIRFGIRLHVITRDSAERAWADAARLIANLDPATIARRQDSLRSLESEGQRRMLALHGGDLDRLVVAPNLWAGIGLARGGAGTALVGDHAEVAERIAEYQALGIDEFILSGYPHLEEAYAFAEGVFPLLRRGSA